MKLYDLIIIGSGPSGVSVAKVVSDKGLSVLIIERGKDINRKKDLTSGWFGQSLFTNRLELKDPIFKNKKAIDEAIKIIKKVSKYNCFEFSGKKLADYYFNCLYNKIDILFNTEAISIKKIENYFIIKTSKKDFCSKNCVIATGRNSINWIKDICKTFGIQVIIKNIIKIGIRVEIPTFRANEILSDTGDIKLSNNDTQIEDARKNSFVGEWEDADVLSAFGYSLPYGESTKTNFMISTKSNEEEGINEVKIANILYNDKIRPEKIKDFMDGRSSMEHLKIFKKFKNTFQFLETIFPLIIEYGIIYSPEVKFKGILPVDDEMKTIIKNLYSVGECTNKVGSLIGALASGIIAGRTIIRS